MSKIEPLNGIVIIHVCSKDQLCNKQYKNIRVFTRFEKAAAKKNNTPKKYRERNQNN